MGDPASHGRGWPMPMVTYLYVRRKALFLARNGSLLKELVVFALSDDAAVSLGRWGRLLTSNVCID